MINKNTPFIYFGGDYNPDQWDDATLERDMELFKKANVNLVTLPVFSWAKLEPSEGVYHFEWLDKILDKLWENNIHVCLATPTTAQPAWMSKKYPEVLPVDIAGRKRTHGMRVFFCVNSEKYRERAGAIAEAMAKRYQNHPALAAWHISNEYGTYCYCENCQKKFREWLKKKYKTPQGLNDAWNLSFWGRLIYDFDEMMLPTELNDDYRFYPQIQLDYMRFVTDSTAECFRNEYDIVKKYTPDIPVMTNISGFIKKLDQFEMLKHMDVAGWDNYPAPTDPPSFVAMKHDIMRGLKGGKSFMMTEQSPNQQNWQPYNVLKRPGEVRLLTYQALAHGSDSCLYFQMRQSVSGQEKLHGAVISHSGREDTRIFRETCQLGAELKAMGDSFIGGTASAEVGMLMDWHSWWAAELSSGPSRDLQYLEQMHKYYRPFHEKNIPVDILPVDADFSKYKMLVAPLLYMVKEGVAEKLNAFVKAGGTLLVSVFSGIVAENDKVVLGGYPGKLSDVLGIWVEETDALPPERKNRLKTTFGKSYSCNLLFDVIHPTTAVPLAVYEEDFYAGVPCVTENAFGQGKGYYIGTSPEDGFLSEFVGRLAEESGVAAVAEVPAGVETTLRTSENGACLFLLNHTEKAQDIRLSGEYIDLVSGEEVPQNLSLAPKDAKVLKRK